VLWNRLQSTGFTNIDFGGFLATNIANQNQLPGWLLTAAGSTSFGFLANWTGSNAVPTPVTCSSP